MISLSTFKNYLLNIIWIFLAHFLKIIIGGFAIVWVIRYLGPEDFGLISYALSIIGILHPITTNLINLKKETKIFLNSLVKSGLNYILIYPNNDHGSDIILKEISKYKSYKKFRIFPSIRFEFYLTLLKNSRFIIGNSSSGIIEAPYYGVSTINIGDRQKNRLPSKLIKNINFDEKLILKSIGFAKNRKIKKRKFFGDGKSARMMNWR